MRVGLNWPYDSRATETTWDLFRALDPSEITISSHEPDAVYERLLDEYPGDRLLWHIRAKANRAWWPKNVDSAEWGNERSLLDRCQWLIARGVVPYVILGNEPDIELAAEPVDTDGNRAHAATAYLNWAAEAIGRLRREVPEARIALAPLSQGNPDRFAYWFRRYQDSGLLGQVDFWACHAYTDGRPFDDPDWGGQPLTTSPKGLPIRVTETNDNGRYFAQDPRERAADYAGYAVFLRDSGAVESLSLFTLPGGAQDASKPSWWFIGPEIVTAVREALAELVAIPPEVPKVANLIKAVDVSSHQTPSLPVLQEWIAAGCQLLWVHSYHSGEQASLQASTRAWVAAAKQAGVWCCPYSWIFGGLDPARQVRESIELFRDAGTPPNIVALDCENYGDPVSDHGPTAEQILTAAETARAMGVAPILYSGKWWTDTIKGNVAVLQGMPAWLANYSLLPTLDIPHPSWVTVLGHQYTSSPVDWSLFNLDALTALVQQDSPAPDPCARLRSDLAAIRDRKPYRAPSRKALAALLT